MESLLYAWFDTEYSSLDLENAAILQVALIITDNSLKRVLPAERDVCLAVHLPADREVSPWVKENLPDLVRQCRSAEACEISEVDNRLSACVADAERASGNRTDEKPVLAGNSIHADWWLAHRFLPNFLGRLHYRQLDVTSLKLEWRRLHRKEFEKDRTENIVKWFRDADITAAGARHDAYYDVQASIAELAFYRRHLLWPGARRKTRRERGQI